VELRAGIFHCHTAFSYDCRLTFADYRRWSDAIGFQFVLLTEHSRERDDTQYQEYRRRAGAASDERLRFIPGIEYETCERHELIAVNARCLPERLLNLAESVEFFRPRSEFLVLPHPSRARLEPCLPELAALMPMIDGMEITNVKRSSKYCPTVDHLSAYNWLSDRFPHLLGISGQDLHEPSGIGGIRVELNRPAASEEEVLSALRSGEYANRLPFHRFASRGPYPIPATLRHAGAFFRWATRSRLSRQQWLTAPVKRLLGAR
jgi:hypothetical protein